VAFERQAVDGATLLSLSARDLVGRCRLTHETHAESAWS
jgi:hypothetical protein